MTRTSIALLENAGVARSLSRAPQHALHGPAPAASRLRRGAAVAAWLLSWGCDKPASAPADAGLRVSLGGTSSGPDRSDASLNPGDAAPPRPGSPAGNSSGGAESDAPPNGLDNGAMAASGAPEARPPVPARPVGDASADAAAPGPRLLRCDPSPSPRVPPIRLTPVVSGLDEPIYVTAAPGDEERLFVVEKPGRIRVLRGGELLGESFIDLSDRVESPVEEMGLLGLAFHPRYQENGLFYVMYSSAAQGGSNPAHTAVLAEYAAVPGDPERAAREERRVLTVAEPEGNHNGGNLQFGADGYLYVGLGDGGGARDQHGAIGNGQALDTLLGKLLRLDVNARNAGPDNQYGIPPGNFSEIAAQALPEIWSIGLRNPWRFSFDACTGDLYIGDVGQETREEVDFHAASEATGNNFGWRLMEAETCFNPSTGCDPEAQRLTLPMASYGRMTGQCITGGYVYRGSAIPELRGAYLYADYQSAAFFALRVTGGALVAAPEDITANLNPDREVDAISSFGQDNAGEVYVVSFQGTVYRIDPR